MTLTSDDYAHVYRLIAGLFAYGVPVDERVPDSVVLCIGHETGEDMGKTVDGWVEAIEQAGLDHSVTRGEPRITVHLGKGFSLRVVPYHRQDGPL